MRAIYLDCFAGISGNMFLGALLQAGVPVAVLEKELAKLPLQDEFQLEVSSVVKNGIHAEFVEVKLRQAQPGHHQEHHHGHHHAHQHVHRTMRDIRGMLEQSSLAMPVKQQALSIFTEIAKAEGKVHGKPADEVAFHEVGAVDSIVDIVGAAICLDYLGIERVFASKLTLGSGFVSCAHGLMPIPAPAVAELLLGWPSEQGSEKKELVTPTGAGIVKTLGVYSEGIPQGFTAECIGYGAGSHELEIPNVLRVYLGEYQGAASGPLTILEANIDDMNPQIYGYLFDKLLAAGALDVWTTPIFMKKNRPAQKLSVLVDEAAKPGCVNLIFSETTSIGLRVMPVAKRLEASRHTAKVETKYGVVDCKVSAWDGKLCSLSPEYEDCRRLAEEKSVPLKVVQQEAIEAFKERLGE
ncbi:nickel pincer cofactor biosynthesis protein LarC [Selenomonas caprae]|uniref:Pyridinium-3,5-bisthiocarboxylic acid mononucleotide nickel insertion protein n=1 Tax=Selenomonas caprae TaxID=2606905 RepID=A0A5D6WJS5_9FIRM|nr:nickel pincer cofactor biosynthesis protein LarC [Selenomonas caprae]TYZ28326.1 nickel pincer cofactor biosynthesis protein LarC [Selenomonas caprae]